MPMSPYVRRLRETIGSAVLLLPAVTVLPLDASGRVLLVRQTYSDQWGTIGRAIDLDESPHDAAVDAALAEANVAVSLGRVVGVLGGPSFRKTYPNGDEVAYVQIVFDAIVDGGTATPNGTTTSEAKWVQRDELAELELSPFAHAQFVALGWLRHSAADADSGA